MHKSKLATPSLVVKLEILQRNLQVMAGLAHEAGVSLRPHIKTHKNIQLAKMQLEAGAQGVTCATISEAEVMVTAGITDIFVAYPLWGDYQLQKAVELNEHSRLLLACDSLAGAERLSKYAGENKTVFRLSLIINTGGNRDGVLSAEAAKLGKQIGNLPNIELCGVMTHESHVHQSANASEVREIAEKAQIGLVATAEKLREMGLPITIVSSGSTPACQVNTQVTGVTEWRPGTYVFNDLNEMKFVAGIDDCALRVLATVVSNPAPGRYILDAGSKVLSEASNPMYGHGLILQAPEAKIEKVNEEHGIVQAAQGSLQLGQRVEIIPVHVCTVVNLSDSFYVEAVDQKVERWQVDARGLVW